MRIAAYRHEENIHLAQSLNLFRAQGLLSEIPEVAQAETVHLPTYKEIGASQCPSFRIVLTGHGPHGYTSRQVVPRLSDDRGRTADRPEKELRFLLQPLLDVGNPRPLIRTVPYLEAFEFFAENVTPIKTKWSSSWAYKAFPSQTLSTIRDFLAKAPNVNDNMYCLAWGGVVSRIAPEDTAFWHREPKFFLNWQASWESDMNAARSVEWVERLRGMLRHHITGAYVNIPDIDIENWPRAYYGCNYPRLQEVKCAYDPENIFRFGQSILPACSDLFAE